MKKRKHCPGCNKDVYTVEHWNQGFLRYETCPKCGAYLVKNIPDYVRTENSHNHFNIPSPLYEFLVAVSAVALLIAGGFLLQLVKGFFS